MSGLRVGVDLGGTKIEVVALGPGGEVRARRRRATPAGAYAATLRAIAEAVAAVEAEAGGRAGGVGVGIPGSISPATGLVRNANSVVLNGRPLERDLTEALARPVRLENDANCFALAEARAGAGRGARLVFGVILGTGIGGGVAIDGRLWLGRNAISGEWGHNPLPRPEPDEIPGPACHCGRAGCIEAWCSGPGLAADHARTTGWALSPPDIAARATLGDPPARATLARHLDRLGRALAAVVNLLDPDLIVLGGGLSNMGHLAEGLPGAVGPHVFSDVAATPIVSHALGDSAGVIGAAWLWPEAREKAA